MRQLWATRTKTTVANQNDPKASAAQATLATCATHTQPNSSHDSECTTSPRGWGQGEALAEGRDYDKTHVAKQPTVRGQRMANLKQHVDHIAPTPRHTHTERGRLHTCASKITAHHSTTKH